MRILNRQLKTHESTHITVRYAAVLTFVMIGVSGTEELADEWCTGQRQTGRYEDGFVHRRVEQPANTSTDQYRQYRHQKRPRYCYLKDRRYLLFVNVHTRKHDIEFKY